MVSVDGNAVSGWRQSYVCWHDITPAVKLKIDAHVVIHGMSAAWHQSLAASLSGHMITACSLVFSLYYHRRPVRLMLSLSCSLSQNQTRQWRVCVSVRASGSGVPLLLSTNPVCASVLSATPAGGLLICYSALGVCDGFTVPVAACIRCLFL